MLTLTQKQHNCTLTVPGLLDTTKCLGPTASKTPDPGLRMAGRGGQWRKFLHLFWSTEYLLHSTQGVKNQSSCEVKNVSTERKVNNFQNAFIDRKRYKMESIVQSTFLLFWIFSWVLVFCLFSWFFWGFFNFTCVKQLQNSLRASKSTEPFVQECFWFGPLVSKLCCLFTGL